MDITDLIKLVETLRKQCPWDREQTLNTLKNKVIEEAYELVDAIESSDRRAIEEEIGDLLFLGFFLAKVAQEEKNIDFDELLSSVVKKYQKKHPHVFGRKKLTTPDEVLKYWQRSKGDVFSGISTSLPALLASKLIQERASKLGFDWKSQAGPLEKINEELMEIKDSKDVAKICEEYGDMLFACVNLGRHLSVDAEDALRYANKKFVKRFRMIIEELKKQGRDIEQTSLEEMDKIWDQIKEADG